MAIRFERPVSPSAYFGRKLGFLSLVMFVSAGLAFRFGPLRMPDMLTISIGAGVIGLAATFFAVIGLVRLWQVGARGGLAAFWALVYASVPLTLTAFTLATYLLTPPVFDVATDPDDPPTFLKAREDDQGWLPRQISPDEAELGAEAYAELVGKRYDGGADRVLAAVRRVAKASRIVIVASEGDELTVPDIGPPPAGTHGHGAAIPVPVPRPTPLLLQPPTLVGAPGDVLLQGEVRTLVFGLPFDVVIRLREDEEATVVDMRTVARYGNRDLGIGAGLINAFFTALDAEMLGLGG